MKLLRTTVLTAALMTAAVPLLTSPADAWRGGGFRGARVGWHGGGWRGAAVGWRGGGWGWRGAGVGLATAAAVRTPTLRPIAKVMGPATATRLTGVTGTPITRFSGTASMPALMVSGVIGADKEPTREWSLL